MRTVIGSTFSTIARAFTTISVAATVSIGLVMASSASAAANPKYSGIVMDARTGKVLYDYKANQKRYPASLTKMMTMYLMFEALDSGVMTKSTRIRFSKYAASRPPSKIGIREGGTIKAEHAIYALATKSANDVAAAVAEHLGGSESGFANLMTRKARQLGMKDTTFKNASGLTARGQLTTARDMAILGIALREHYPHYYKYFETRTFRFGKRNYSNHNRLLGRVRGVDGIKTGYTRASGFNLVTSVEDRGRSIVAVVIGGRSGKSRNAQMQNMIAKYLGKATRRSKKKMLVAAKTPVGFNGAAVSVAALELPQRGPVPRFRTSTFTAGDKRILNAHSTEVASIASVAPNAYASEQQFNAAKVRQKLLEISGKQVPVPTENPVPPANVDPVTTAAVTTTSPNPGGWHVQIGATDSRSQAIELLEKARTRLPDLKQRELYTETVEKGNSVLHRARFVGFASKSEAWAACKSLKRKKFACLALQG